MLVEKKRGKHGKLQRAVQMPSGSVGNQNKRDLRAKKGLVVTVRVRGGRKAL